MRLVAFIINFPNLKHIQGATTIFSAESGKITDLNAQLEKNLSAINEKFTAMDADIDERLTATVAKFDDINEELATLKANIEEILPYVKAKLDQSQDTVDWRIDAIQIPLDRNENRESIHSSEVCVQLIS